ncbi:helix-turn-helix domain-containing protein [Thermoleophilia bacterium SCSIO 60948]|nr:helix-turn-helix domain-containing protein [Thermoleophilia bacterium SCSIO 60948]
MSETDVYVERPPLSRLAPYVVSVWRQSTSAPYLQRHLPHGGAELRCKLGEEPEIVGPSASPRVEELPGGTSLVGARFHPGGLAALLGRPSDELTDLRVDAAAVLGPSADGAGETIAGSSAPLIELQEILLAARDRAMPVVDPLVSETVERLRPRHGERVADVSRALFISERQLRRRCEVAVGLSPKALQRILRFQTFRAMAQLAIAQGRGPTDDGLAAMAASAGYADQSHLTRECTRLTGTTPASLLGVATERCSCGHDHAASFASWLRAHPA